MTPFDVRKFQSDPRNVGPFGKPLGVDGTLGPQTQWALDFQAHSLARKSIVLAALAHYGLVETAPNDDSRGLIRGWLKAAGAQPGDPWCAAFASACIDPYGYRCASAMRLGQHYPATTFEAAAPADLVWFPTDALGHGHVELLLGADLTARLAMTIGGNVANGVRLSLRPAGGVSFARTVNDFRAQTPGVIRHPDVPLRMPSFAGTR